MSYFAKFTKPVKQSTIEKPVVFFIKVDEIGFMYNHDLNLQSCQLKQQVKDEQLKGTGFNFQGVERRHYKHLLMWNYRKNIREMHQL